MACVDGVVGVTGFFEDRQEVVQLVAWDHAEGRANRGFELTRGLEDLLHEAVLAEVLDEALVAFKDGRDVLVRRLKLPRHRGDETAQLVDLSAGA